MNILTLASRTRLLLPIVLTCAMVVVATGASDAILDEFSSDSGVWEPQGYSGAGGFQIANDSLSYVTRGVLSEGGGAELFQKQTLSATEPWLVQVDLNLGSPIAVEYWRMAIVVQSESNPKNRFVCQLSSFGEKRLLAAYPSVDWNQSEAGGERTTTSTNVSFQLFFDPRTKAITASYDEDRATNGYSFQTLFKAALNSRKTDWKLADSSRFRLGLIAFSTPGLLVGPGQLTFDHWLVEANPEPRTFEVSQDGVKPLSRIQAAIDLARSGDLVLVAPGRYPENITFRGKDVTVASMFVNSLDSSAITNTVIDGGANGSPVVTFNSCEMAAQLLGFTITNGLARSQAGGIVIEANSVARIDHCRLLGNRNAVGVKAAERESTFESCVFYGNSGPVISLQEAPLRIRRCSFVGNTSGAGAIVDWYVSGGLVEMDHCLFVNNKCSEVLAVPRQFSASPSSFDEAHVINCTFYSNTVAIASISSEATCVVLNSILMDQAPAQLVGKVIAADYNLVRGGLSSVHAGREMYYGKNNLSDPAIFPTFSGPDGIPTADSGAVGAGIRVWAVPLQPILVAGGPDLFGNEAPSPIESAPDLGAVELPYGGPLSVLPPGVSLNGQYGEAFSFQLEASNQPEAFDYVGLPAGLDGNRTDGIISGMPMEMGSRTVAVMVKNRWGVSTNQLETVIGKGLPVINWNPPSSAVWGSPLDKSTLYAAVSALPGLFSYEPALGTILNVGLHDLKLTFSPFDPHHYESVVLTRQVAVTQADQQLTFDLPPVVVLGDPPIRLAANSSSGLPVQFQIRQGQANLTGDTLELTGGGMVVLQALQPGDEHYRAAPPLTRSLDVRLRPEVVQKPGGSVLREPAAETVRFGDFLSLTALPEEGFLFDGWQGDVSSKANPLWLIVTNNLHVTALFRQSLSLTVRTSSGGTVQIVPDLPVYPEGTVVHLTAISSPHNAFARWSGAVAGTNSTVSLTLITNVVVEASFIPCYRLAVTMPQDLNRGFRLELAGENGVQYQIETSSELEGWTPLQTVVFLAGQNQYWDTQARNLSRRFYRIRPVD